MENSIYNRGLVDFKGLELRVLCCVVVLAGLLPDGLSARVEEPSVQSLMDQLDSVIAVREDYVAERQKTIIDYKHQLSAAITDSARYYVLGRLFDTYSPFNTDSAYYYSRQKEKVARRMGRNDYILDSRLNQAAVLTSVGMYHEATQIINVISGSELPGYLRPYYYHIKRTIAGFLADYAAFPPLRARYNALTKAYRDSLMAVNDPNSLAYVISKADQYNSYGQYQNAVKTIRDFMAKQQLSEHDMAICAWTLSESYGHLGDRQNQKRQLLISSIGDLKSAVREYVSLRELALVLYKEGDLERAYNLMNIAIDDAGKCNARLRIVELSRSYPEITAIYVDKVKTQQKRLIGALIVILLLLIIITVSLIYVRKQMKIISRSRKEVAEANDHLEKLNGELNDLNKELKDKNEKLSDYNVRLNEANTRLNEANTRLTDANVRLTDANRQIAENSRLKEAYIGRYMDQCLSYIDNLDSYRKGLLKMVSAGKTDALKESLKSSDTINNELKNFYDNFDKTFLSLFPTFVADFNALLAPGEEIKPKKDGSLNTELRIFALIRLGITDSESIAKFLRYSLTTIYNYRTKVRNKAAGDRSQLESLVMKIGVTEE